MSVDQREYMQEGAPDGAAKKAFYQPKLFRRRPSNAAFWGRVSGRMGGVPAGRTLAVLIGPMLA